jgi:hypothetical protein
MFPPANYATQPLQKAGYEEDCKHDRWGAAPGCCTDEAAMHLIAEP